MNRIANTPGDLPHPGIEPRCPALRADSLLSKPPGKPTFHVSLWGKKKIKTLEKYATFDLSLFFPFPLCPKQGIVIYLSGEFGKENQTCSLQFFLSSCSLSIWVGGSRVNLGLTVAGQIILHIEFLQRWSSIYLGNVSKFLWLCIQVVIFKNSLY